MVVGFCNFYAAFWFQLPSQTFWAGDADRSQPLFPMRRIIVLGNVPQIGLKNWLTS